VQKISNRTEILVSGFGGQCVVRIGQILGLSSVLEGLFTTMPVNHGTETRGGYVRTQVVIFDETVDSPVVEEPTIFCALSKAAYNKFYKMVSDGVVIYDPAYVKPDDNINIKQIPIAARDLAIEKLGNDIFANMMYMER
jgi:2-oxoglutarate ferredoxin oxidoreductase subunit gamma